MTYDRIGRFRWTSEDSCRPKPFLESQRILQSLNPPITNFDTSKRLPYPNAARKTKHCVFFHGIFQPWSRFVPMQLKRSGIGYWKFRKHWSPSAWWTVVQVMHSCRNSIWLAGRERGGWSDFEFFVARRRWRSLGDQSVITTFASVWLISAVSFFLKSSWFFFNLLHWHWQNNYLSSDVSTFFLVCTALEVEPAPNPPRRPIIHATAAL